ncbi:RCC1 and BTB domain-containing protein 1 [Folsomia candida]|nr:RCC1 and BTB domain-containing protein 1 [Folsomia candida]
MDELFAKSGVTSYRTISAQIEPPPRRRKHADVTFSVDEKVITAHKCILAERSEYFETMFSHEWKEAKEGSTIEVEDVKHEIFEAFLFYIYSEKIKFEEDEYKNICDLMKLADSHCDNHVREECEQILIRNINKENAFFLARNASSANALTLGGKVVKFILDKKLLVKYSSSKEMIDLVGLEAFHEIAVALTHH